jgi:hypothetical protein
MNIPEFKVGDIVIAVEDLYLSDLNIPPIIFAGSYPHLHIGAYAGDKLIISKITDAWVYFLTMAGVECRDTTYEAEKWSYLAKFAE